MRERLTLRIVEDLGEVPTGEWNALAGGNPLLRHEFFSALHETGGAGSAPGGRRASSPGGKATDCAGHCRST